MTPRLACVLALALTALVAVGAGADPSPTVPAPSRAPEAPPSAEEIYHGGLRARASKDWKAAVGAFRRATELKPRFPEAWNELGYALHNLGQYQESVRAYDEALRQRPNFPEALEYLGEVYVKMGRKDDARKILDRLRPLDAERARELAAVIGASR
jgi:Flp pilus assembly protein TadD